MEAELCMPRTDINSTPAAVEHWSTGDYSRDCSGHTLTHITQRSHALHVDRVHRSDVTYDTQTLESHWNLCFARKIRVSRDFCTAGDTHQKLPDGSQESVLGGIWLQRVIRKQTKSKKTKKTNKRTRDPTSPTKNDQNKKMKEHTNQIPVLGAPGTSYQDASRRRTNHCSQQLERDPRISSRDRRMQPRNNHSQERDKYRRGNDSGNRKNENYYNK